MLAIFAPLASNGASACASRNGPIALVRKLSSSCSALTRPKRSPECSTPALLTSRSSLPASSDTSGSSRGEPRMGLRIGDIQRQHVQAAGILAGQRIEFGSLAGMAAGRDDAIAARQQLADEFQAEAAIGAGHQAMLAHRVLSLRSLPATAGGLGRGCVVSDEAVAAGFTCEGGLRGCGGRRREAVSVAGPSAAAEAEFFTLLSLRERELRRRDESESANEGITGITCGLVPWMPCLVRMCVRSTNPTSAQDCRMTMPSRPRAAAIQQGLLALALATSLGGFAPVAMADDGTGRERRHPVRGVHPAQRPARDRAHRPQGADRRGQPLVPRRQQGRAGRAAAASRTCSST